MNKEVDMLDSVLQIIKSFNPGVKVKRKNEIWYHRLLGKVFKQYKRFSTTIGNTIAMADGHGWEVLVHEGRHTLQGQKQGVFLHSFLYLFPQILVPICLLLCFISPWFLLGLLFGAPIPAYFRMKKELQAYRDSVIVSYWKYGHRSSSQIEFIVNMFSGPSYYFMWPFKSYIRNKLYDFSDEARLWKVGKEPYLDAVYFAMKRNGLYYE